VREADRQTHTQRERGEVGMEDGRMRNEGNGERRRERPFLPSPFFFSTVLNPGGVNVVKGRALWWREEGERERGRENCFHEIMMKARSRLLASHIRSFFLSASAPAHPRLSPR